MCWGNISAFVDCADNKSTAAKMMLTVSDSEENLEHKSENTGYQYDFSRIHKLSHLNLIESDYTDIKKKNYHHNDT